MACQYASRTSTVLLCLYHGPEHTAVALAEWAEDNGVMLYFIQPAG